MNGETNHEQIEARAERILAKIRDRRNARIDRALGQLATIKEKLAWRRAQGFGYWLGPASRFKSDIGKEIDLFYCPIDPMSMN